MKKRALSLLLTLAILLTAMPQSVVLADDETNVSVISVDSINASAGETVDVNILITNNPGILGATLTLSFDEGLTLTAAKAGDAFQGLTMTKPGKLESPCKFVWDGQDLDSENIKDGVILTLTFQVADTLAAGSVRSIFLSAEAGSVIDENLNPIRTLFQSGTITILDYTPGDLNGDEIVNTSDVIMLRRFIAGGYDLSINELAANVNGDAITNTADVIMIRRFIAGGYVDASGDPIKLLPAPPQCQHVMEATAYQAATCTEDGHIAYWHCTVCGKYFSNAAGTAEISLANTMLPATGHIEIIDPAVPATTTSKGLTQGSHCASCGIILVEQQETDMLASKEHSVTYDIANGDTYLEGLVASNGIANNNPDRFSEENGVTLKNLSVSGYRFLGWYDGAGANATQIKKIAQGSTDDIELYAHWEKIQYTVQFKSSLFLDTDEATYTVDRGVVLPTPKLSNYVFAGWSDEDGHLYPSTKIPAGTTGNITLTANWTSERNKTWTRTKLDEPIIYEDEENDTILFAYEIGEIQNVPLYTIKDFGYISGDGITKTASETYSTTISESSMQAYTRAVASATTESSSWTLSENWNKTTSINEQWCEENGYTKQEAETVAKSNTNNWNISSSSSGSTDTTNLSTNQDSWENQVKVNSSNERTDSTKVASSLSGTLSASAPGIKAEVSAEVSAEDSTSTTRKSGMEIGGTDGNTKITTDSTVSSTAWNSSSSYGGSSSSSVSSTTSTALSKKISESYGYGESYTSGGAGSETQGLTSTKSSSDEYSASVTYSKATSDSVTSTWTTQSTKPGYHRWVVAGTAHVFAIVGYDMSTQSYFVYTLSVMDDETHEFEDYSYTSANYNDEQNGVLSFEVPYEVAEYVANRTCWSSGLKVDQQTGKITGYSGTDDCVVIPEYMNVGNGDVVKITGISTSAFKGNTNIKVVVLSDFITEIPDRAFEGCTSLVGVIGGSVTNIGSKAFSGCVAANNCVVNSKVTYLGAHAFDGVNRLIAWPANGAVAEAAVDSGAKNLVIHLNSLADGASELSGKMFTIPSGTEGAEINGYAQTFENFTIISDSEKTVINKMNLVGQGSIPLQISSPEVVMNQVTVQATGIALVLSADSTNLGMQGTIAVGSNNTNAVLCKDINLYESNALVDGCLAVNGKILVCGAVDDAQHLTYDEYETIDTDTFDRMLHSYTLYFDANGGSCDITSRSVPNSTALGELPIPVRDYYSFAGWYLEDGSTQVTAETVFSSGLDVTIYAHWEQNAVSGWVKASELPEDAQIVDAKWSYTLREYTTSSASSYSGWTKYDTKRTSWGSTQGPVYSNPSNGSRNVWSEQYVTSSNYKTIYVYHRWTSGSADSGSTYSYNTGYDHVYRFDYPLTILESSNWYGHTTYQYWYEAANGNTRSGHYKIVIYSGTEQQWASDNYGTRWYYQEPVYTYYYYRDLSKEAASDPTGQSNVSNVQKWVQYRSK